MKRIETEEGAPRAVAKECTMTNLERRFRGRSTGQQADHAPFGRPNTSGLQRWINTVY